MIPSKLQVPDDFELLDLMAEDELKAPRLYRATNYWSHYASRFLPELHEFGLKDFRRRRNSVLSSFGATDLRPLPKLDYWFVNWLPARIKKYLGSLVAASGVYRERRRAILSSYVEAVGAYGESAGATALSEFSGTFVGNPEEIHKEGGNIYTIAHLNYYLQYAYCSQFIDFSSISVIVELGSGSGKQVEVIKRLHPHITFLLFDIVPQIYVCEQYLKTLFPESVVSYRYTRDMMFVPEERYGKIFIFGAYKFPITQNMDVDLFWNSASFQEMEPEVVQNYIDYVRSCSQYVYLREVISGQYVAAEEGDFGVLRKTTLKDYVNFLSGFRMVNISRAFSVGWSDLAYLDYYDCLWERNT